MNAAPPLRTILLRVVALALLLLLVLVGVLTSRTLGRVPDAIVYFVQSDGDGFTLEGVTRNVQVEARGADTREAHLRAVLAALAEGPTEAERARGLSTALPENLEVLDVHLEGGQLVLDLGPSVEAGGGTALMTGRLQQLYYSLTQPRWVESLELWLGGERARAFSGEGLLLEQPWRRADHSQLPRW